MVERERKAGAAGQPVVREFYADRDYDESGSIVFTRDVGRPDLAVDAVEGAKDCTVVMTYSNQCFAWVVPKVAMTPRVFPLSISSITQGFV